MEPCEATTNRRMMAVAIFSIYETWQQVMQNSILGSRKYISTYKVHRWLDLQLWLDVALGYLFLLLLPIVNSITIQLMKIAKLYDK